MRKFIAIFVSTAFTVGTLVYTTWQVNKRPVAKGEIVFVETVDPAEVLKWDFRCDAVPPLVVKRMPYLGNLPLDKRKTVFIRIVLPTVLVAKKKVQMERQRVIDILKHLQRKESLRKEDVAFLNRMMKKYRTTSTERLLIRMAPTPVSLILAQAALESGWGTSRFSVEGNNIFGIWTFRGDGLRAVSGGATLKKYNSLLEAVEDYLYNINVGWAYVDFRNSRFNTTDPFVLVNHLEGYSVLRDEYVQRVNELIRTANLQRFDKCRLSEEKLH